MAHLVETMAYAGETPWHNTNCKKVPADLTPLQFLEAAGCDWEVEKVPTFYQHKGESKYTGNFAVVRDTDSKILTEVGPEWQPVQNRQMAEFFHDFVMDNEISIETGGSLKDGKIVWFLGKTKEAFELFKGEDVIENYLLFSNYHQFGFSTDIRNTDVRVVCHNTFSAAHTKGNANAIKFHHRHHFDVEDAKTALKKAKNSQQTYKEKAEYIASRPFNPGDPMDYFRKLFPTDSANKAYSRNAALCNDLMDTQPGAALGEGTWWQAFNAVTYAVDHKIGRDYDKRMTSAWYGDNREVKSKALELALDYAR